MPSPFLEDPLTLVPGRIATFKKWPHTRPEDKCVPQTLADAGFYHRPDVSEDSVQCFVCHKLLYGWASDEDPMAEHKAHCPDCAFVRLVEAHGGGYEKAPRQAVIDAECARFRAKFTYLFEEEVRRRLQRYENDLQHLKKAAISFVNSNNPVLSSTVVKTRNARKGFAC
ncbi:Baculoviral IAP repeat-containing protein 5 [Echinococcus granulosus]|uniref:Baculoviral IAP repeat containing protein n=1 Tax=Echinococcus granulosus TaxID=6210 RepID=A0A068WFX1_ECHGR|nr:Baculoviral IAP repeat-containing protein 5 [Echinococcus granulosus]CDS17298.1 baculoviral IAP repeat containing protein [Echinococcus granulosus]